MLEGAVARLLNYLLGKYVVDLDTENLNVGIFSGQVQLTDLKLKTEALYELGLPVEVKAGAIGKIWLQIPWTSLWNQPVIVNIEDLHIVFGPIVSGEPFDPEKNKRLLRAFKRKILQDLDGISNFQIGPSNGGFKHFLNNVLSNLQLTISNVHVRYEDRVSFRCPISAGVCVGNIIADSTNSKWKPAKSEPSSGSCYYLVKIETLSTYWNHNSKLKQWDLPSQYYAWRNAMTKSLQKFAMEEDAFSFVVKPMMAKVKVTISKDPSGGISACSTDLSIQDCNVQLSKEQYDSILSVRDSLKRMEVSWSFLSSRPGQKILEDKRSWWRYAYGAVVQQRVKPYTWVAVKEVRDKYRRYLNTYKQYLSNPNDTEIKLDLQKHEDDLSVVNLVIARRQARLLIKPNHTSTENSFWSLLPSPEISSYKSQSLDASSDETPSATTEYRHSFRIGNVTIALVNKAKEVVISTITQLGVTVQTSQCSYKVSMKVQGFMVEGCNLEEHLVTVVTSEKLNGSSGHVLKIDFEALPMDSVISHRLVIVLNSVEFWYNKHFLHDIRDFLNNEHFATDSLHACWTTWPKTVEGCVTSKLKDRWDICLNIKTPLVIIPGSHSSHSKGSDNIFVIDLGKYCVSTDLYQVQDSGEHVTQNELEEKFYSKLYIECTDQQVLFCRSEDNWRDSRKERDTDLHFIPKTSYNATYAICPQEERSIPSYKFNINFQTLKLNLSERRIGQVFRFFCSSKSGVVFNKTSVDEKDPFLKDKIEVNPGLKVLLRVQNVVTICDSFPKRKGKMDEKKSRAKEEKRQESAKKEDMNEVYAKYVDLPGLEDNISPQNVIILLLRIAIKEFSVVYSRSSDSSDREYLMLRLDLFTADVALMTYGPAYQISLNSILLTDKLHTTPSGQYLDLVYTPFPSTVDVVTVLYRKVDASCPDFWTYFHGVETSLVADLGTVHVMLHQEAIHTIIKYSKYLYNKIEAQIPSSFQRNILDMFISLNKLLHKTSNSMPVPPGSVKFSQSVRMADINVRICDSDFDIINIQLSGLEVDFLFRANERFVFRSYLGNINVEHLSDVTLYSKVLSTDEDKVFEMKYVKQTSPFMQRSDVSPGREEPAAGGSFKFYLGQIHITILYKLFVQIQRFIVNLEALPYLNQLYAFCFSSITSATETLKTDARTNLAINLCGPVILFPQKSSSPNVVVIDTGELSVENFFKTHSSNDVLENIMLKWTRTTITRGVMTLTATLEMQETLVEPVNLYLDIKRYTNTKNAQKTWDLDGVLEPIQITLGQRDISTVLSIYTDNVGEGQILDLFPKQPKEGATNAKDDETMKSLEVFFCDPKQKNVVAKFNLEEISVLLFFDSGELLSSPIRDINHGLCMFRVGEISTLLVVYNDGSLDGKLSAESILVEEVGPDANLYERRILKSTMDDSKNNNCNITINRAPIVDVTCYQNSSGDKSADVIIGRLTLSLSVPFCEKLALFVIECLPKDNPDIGIVNHGYECDIHTPEPANREPAESLTVSMRINKPEFVFVVETTSNKKRYFSTHAEILADYSRHSNRLNLILSLSGLHSLFHDVGSNSSTPYAILKQCDVEVSKCYSEEKGKKIMVSVSSIYVKLCSKVMHSLTDILNDIVEHFKVPDFEPSKFERKAVESEELWEPKKIGEICELTTDPAEEVPAPSVTTSTSNSQFPFATKEILLVPKFDTVLVFELEEVQVLLFKSTMEVTVYDWSSFLNCTCDLTLQANYFNENIQKWEPVIDPVVTDEKEYKPWDLLVKIFQDKSAPMHDPVNNRPKNAAAKENVKSHTTTEDEDSGEDMMYLEPVNTLRNRINRRVKTSLSTFLDDSDSENEDGTMEKLAAAISDLFTGDWNENEDSDYIHSSDGEDDSDENIGYKSSEKTNKMGSHQKATYVMIDAKEVLNVSVTPSLLKLLNELYTAYSNKTISVITGTRSINLVNDIGPHTKVELYEKRSSQKGEEEELVCVKTFENEESAPATPTKNNYLVGDNGEDMYEDSKTSFNQHDSIYKGDVDVNYDFDTLASLQFPSESTAQLYDMSNKHRVKILIPNFPPTQTNCSNRNWHKLVKLHSSSSNQTYHIAAKHFIAKGTRNLVVSSPLQIKNETSYALSVLYQPSVLQQLNLEPVGDVTNPFESTMRIAVLEAHESYNVPLYIAYHCKLFIQPAYAEGNYTSDSGIWWCDLATELDIAHNLHCRPKGDSNLELFTLKVMLRKNLEIRNSQAHSMPNYVIHVLPPLIFHNLLPYTLEVESGELKNGIKIEPGEKKSIYSMDLSKDQKLNIKVKYNLLTWCGSLNFTTYLDEKFVVLSSDAKDAKHLTINVRTDREGSCDVFFYAPYWIVNKTGLPLQIRASAGTTVYESSNEDILLFTYKRHGKQTLNVRVYESSWSNEFGLECAGTTGLIICRNNERKKKYWFFLTIKLSEICPRLTKIVTLLPSFLIYNNSSKHLRFMEYNERTDLWLDIAPGQTLIFWPETSSMHMHVKYRDSKIISQAFNISVPNITVLRMDKGGALTVEVSGGLSDPFVINFTDYKPGDAPILIKNCCADIFLKIQQQDESQVQLLSPYHSLLYTWDDPTKTRKIAWNIYNNKRSAFVVDVSKDAHGEAKIRLHSITATAVTTDVSSSSDDSDCSDIASGTLKGAKKVRKDKVVVYWLCYRTGLQRILLFTQELRIYLSVLKNYFLEHCSFESLISAAGIDVSVFTTENSTKEHICATFADSPAIWEVNVGHKWKTLTLELAAWIEDKYQMHYKKCQLKDYIHIDFEKMYMLKPFFAELKRTYTPALYCQFRKSGNFQHFIFKTHIFQIDNKLANTIVLQPLPRYFSKDLMSFLDINVLKYSSKDCCVYRHIKGTIGNLYLNIESDLFLTLSEMLGNYKMFNYEGTQCYVADMKYIQDLLGTRQKNRPCFQQNAMIEHLALGNFEVQLHVSNKSNLRLSGNGTRMPICRMLSYLFPVNMAPYMPMEGITYKISAVECWNIKGQLWETGENILTQLSSQFLQQYYSHVLGLQVLVNAFAAQTADSKELQSDVGKTASLLLYGFRCLLSHINMSPAALEQCVVDIFANQSIENIQRIRRHGPYKKSEAVPKNITASSRNFHSGVPNALNQLIVKQQNAGINYDGEMFFRTTGKALISLVTRHHDEKSDSVEIAKEALRRAAILGEPIKIQQRLTRYCNKYLGLCPFSVHESMGQHLLGTVAQCRYINDTYWSHAATDKSGKSILLVTLQHVIRINKCRPWGVWDVEWAIDLDDIMSMPKITGNEIVFLLRKMLLHQCENIAEQQLNIAGDQEMLVWIHDKIEQAVIVSMEEKSWTVEETS